LTKLGTYLVLKRIWNPSDFQGQRSRSPGQIFRRGDTPHFALPLFLVQIRYSVLIVRQYLFQGYLTDSGVVNLSRVQIIMSGTL